MARAVAAWVVRDVVAEGRSLSDALEQRRQGVDPDRDRALIQELAYGVLRHLARLQALAEEPTDQPRSRAFLTRTRLASASAGQAVQVLLDKDIVHAGPDGRLKVLDPAVQWYLAPPAEFPGGDRTPVETP